MKTTITALCVLLTTNVFVSNLNAQVNKNKKSRYYQNSNPEPEFNVKGFFVDNEKNEVEEKPTEDQYDVKLRRNETDGKYQDEKRVLRKADDNNDDSDRTERRKTRMHTTTYGTYRVYDVNRPAYDKYTQGETTNPEPEVRPTSTPKNKKEVVAKPKEKVIKMTSNENEYVTTVVKKRYTNLDVLSDDLDLAKIQRPVFKGICQECDRDVDRIITNKNWSNLEKNYQLKQCYMQRDKRLREVLDVEQYKKWLRIKDADEYLILTKDPELKDGIYK